MKMYRAIPQSRSLFPSIMIAAIAAAAAGFVTGTHARDAQLTFATPEAASKALADAARADDENALGDILGQSWQDALSSGDAAVDKVALKAFVAQYDQMNRWTAMTDGTRILHVGADNYPYPIPLAHAASSWHFDSTAGEREVAARRIGANELLAIDAVNVIAQAEEAYLDGAGNEVKTYARSIVSGDGKHDGLYWSTTTSEQPSPLAALGDLAAEGTRIGEPLTLDGYTYRILAAQGAGAKGGAKSYVGNGAMTGGFAVLASPVEYGTSGIMTFMLNREGVVYEKDLGDDTARTAKTIAAYDPANGWTAVE
jgi:Protein of unknown function (DUF2950)